MTLIAEITVPQHYSINSDYSRLFRTNIFDICPQEIIKISNLPTIELIRRTFIKDPTISCKCPHCSHQFRVGPDEVKCYEIS